MLKKYLFVDLDDTLFQSYGKCPLSDQLQPLAYLKDGQPISYATPSQIATLKMFQQEMRVIPVTARNMDAFSRVAITFTHGAVLNYGAVILKRDGKPDEFWLEQSRNNSAHGMEGLAFFLEYIEQQAADCRFDLKARIIKDLDLPFYVVAKSPGYDTAAVAKMAQMCAEVRAAGNFSDYRIHLNGNNLAVLPHWLDKRAAVGYLIEQLKTTEGELITFGMGDSLIDISFMNECQYMIVPSGSQIAKNRLVGL